MLQHLWHTLHRRSHRGDDNFDNAPTCDFFMKTLNQIPLERTNQLIGPLQFKYYIPTLVQPAWKSYVLFIKLLMNCALFLASISSYSFLSTANRVFPSPLYSASIRSTRCNFEGSFLNRNCLISGSKDWKSTVVELETSTVLDEKIALQQIRRNKI